MTKTLLLIGTLALAGIASAKSYDMTLVNAAKAAGVELPAGNYLVKIVGGNFALFTNVDTGKKILAPVKVQDAGRKFEQTAVASTNRSGEKKIVGVELGGSSTMIELGE